VDALPVIVRKDSIDLFTKYKVYSEGELTSRYNILCETYVKTITIEGNLTRFMAQTQILPACLRYQTEVANSVAAVKAAGVDAPAQTSLLKTLSEGISDLTKAISTLDGALNHAAHGELIDHAKYSRDKVIPAMTAVRAAADKLEGLVADDLWPIPTYREMLFIR
jgi:glutamine synthetase